MSDGRERRLRIVYLDEHLIVAVLNWMHATEGSWLAIDECDAVPEGSRVEYLFAAPERRAIGAVVTHPSFSLVAPGCEIPRWDGLVPFSRHRVLLKDEEHHGKERQR